MTFVRQLLFVLAVLAATGASARADRITLFAETWGDATYDTSLASHGWQSSNTWGTTYTDSTSNPSRIVYSTDYTWAVDYTAAFLGSGSTAAQWPNTGKVDFRVEDYWDLAVSFHGDEHASSWYRVSLKIDDQWYLQADEIPSAGYRVLTTKEVPLADTNFILWTGAPPDDSTSWDVPATGGGSLLPSSGHVTGLGIMNWAGSSSGDRVRIDNIRITGIPEPGAWLLVLSALACGLLLRRRRAV